MQVRWYTGAVDTSRTLSLGVRGGFLESGRGEGAKGEG